MINAIQTGNLVIKMWLDELEDGALLSCAP